MHHVQEGLLLAGKGGIGQVLGGGRGAHGEGGLRVAGTECGELGADGLFQIGRERLGLDHGADLGAGGRQRADVLGVERIEPGIDALGQAVVLEELAERVGRGGKAGGHLHAAGQLRNHLAEAGVLAADGLDIAHPELFKGNDQVGRTEQLGHGKTPEVEKPGGSMHQRMTCSSVVGRAPGKAGRSLSAGPHNHPTQQPTL